MTSEQYPIGMHFDVVYPEFTATLTLLSDHSLKFEISEGPFAHAEEVQITVQSLGNGVFAVSWKEDSGATVVNIQDFDRRVVHSFATLPDGKFLRMLGEMTRIRSTSAWTARPIANKALVLDAMISLFQDHDTSAVERLYAEDYIQHNPNIPQGRAALRQVVATLPEDVYYEPGMVIAEGDKVAIHGRIRGWAERSQVVVDIFRVENGRLVEHWDVMQDEVEAGLGAAGIAMFDPAETEA